ncbi:MAG: protein translocase subunit SecD [Saccharospirillaceae bacterium]|nr:protein translocase subunit SecD [Pseudomonadales bacterium]NRB77958.1 protein translocase subunit SecD [Saccharospirillaceae bacterium]
MLNKFSLWKYLMIVAIIVTSVIYAMPNMYQPDKAVQITATKAGTVMSQLTQERAINALKAEGIIVFGVKNDGVNLLLRLPADKQSEAKAILDDALGTDYITGLAQASTTPSWLEGIGGAPMSKGLDLAGGIYFLKEVDMDHYLRTRLDSSAESIKSTFRRGKGDEFINVRTAKVTNDLRIEIKLKNKKAFERAVTYLKANNEDFADPTLDEPQLKIYLQYTESRISRFEDYVINQNIIVYNQRVNMLGNKESSITRQGRNRIVIELPGIQDGAAADKILGSNANLEFRMKYDDKGPYIEVPYKSSVRYGSDKLKKEIIITGSEVASASASPERDSTKYYVVNLSLSARGGNLMFDTTTEYQGQDMAVVFIDNVSEKVYTKKDGKLVIDWKTTRTQEIISMATINGQFGSSFQITGRFSQAEATELANLISAGSLAAPMRNIASYAIGPSLGAENIRVGVMSVLIGFALVFMFMILVYRLFGLFANIALVLNLLMLVAIMSAMGATLTLPGIAGVVLTVGMAVDANVLIFSRIREELKAGLGIQQAISAGYDRAYVTILDANITTFIVAAILFMIGSGPIKGFAVTLGIGIVVSMFTAILVTRALTNLWYGGREVKKLSI